MLTRLAVCACCTGKQECRFRYPALLEQYFFVWYMVHAGTGSCCFRGSLHHDGVRWCRLVRCWMVKPRPGAVQLAAPGQTMYLRIRSR